MAARWEGPPGAPFVVLIHGVGFGPDTLDPVVRALAARGLGGTCVAERRGYGSRAAEPVALTVADHVADVIALLDERRVQCAVLAGMSGGATVALAAALTRPERVTLAIAHEPAVGSVSPELRSLIVQALGSGGGVRLMQFLAGERTWARLDPEQRASLTARAPLIEADAAAFARFEPDLHGCRVPLVCSLGELSAPERVQVAERLSARTRAPIAVVPGCGHLPQLDAPDAFAELIINHVHQEVLPT